MNDNLEMVDIPESKLNNPDPCVRYHVKKFVVPHVKKDNEKIYHVPMTDLNEPNMNFSVITTNVKKSKQLQIHAKIHDYQAQKTYQRRNETK
jgi:hypothetical protein